MGQSFCKECEGRFKPGAVVSWGGDDGYWYGDDDRDTHTTGANSSLRSSPSNGNLDPKRSNRIKHKKRSVALHAQFRDRQGLLLAPPLVTEKIMEDTDCVFTGQDLGIETSNICRGSSKTLFDSIPQDSRSGSCDFSEPVANGQQVVRFEKTPEEDAFLDRVLADDDNFVFDGMSAQFRQKLKDSMERVVVQKSTLIIRKGDDPDYLYLILEGEVAVYIDEEEYIDENAVETGKHALIDISLKSKSSRSLLSGGSSSRSVAASREFKQSYVLNLRKSLFASTYKDTGEEKDEVLGQVLSLEPDSFLGQDSRISTLTGIVKEIGSTGSEDEVCASFIPLNELRGLKHERDLGPADVFGELGLIYNCPRSASCLTTSNCIMYRVEGEQFRSILAASNSERVKKRCTESKAAILSLRNLGVVEELNEKALSDIEDVLSPVTFEKDDLVITKGAYDNIFFFVMSGKLIAHNIGDGDSR